MNPWLDYLWNSEEGLSLLQWLSQALVVCFAILLLCGVMVGQAAAKRRTKIHELSLIRRQAAGEHAGTRVSAGPGVGGVSQAVAPEREIQPSGTAPASDAQDALETGRTDSTPRPWEADVEHGHRLKVTHRPGTVGSTTKGRGRSAEQATGRIVLSSTRPSLQTDTSARSREHQWVAVTGMPPAPPVEPPLSLAQAVPSADVTGALSPTSPPVSVQSSNETAAPALSLLKMTPPQRAAVLQSLRRFSGQRVLIQSLASDPKSRLEASVLETIFLEAGWRVERPVLVKGGGEFGHGYWIGVREPHHAPKAVDSLWQSLASLSLPVGGVVDDAIDPDLIVLRVGQNP